jgi:hypothetical protein
MSVVVHENGQRDGGSQKQQCEPRQSGRKHREEPLHTRSVIDLRNAAYPMLGYRVIPLSGDLSAPD